ncbi:alpha/beta fold hydrolase [Ruegeria atlantica]|uniref:alpha/beta fold hydrolase n=1 Tax=Ruegeria atlantica TaxID=81569 RepID=UPI00147E0FDD|nr:alpha/beta hydrolase [Ruegeria atlantica]
MQKTPVVFLPGLLNDEELWQQQVEDLSSAVDPMIADLTLDDSIEAMADRVLASISGPFVLVSMSMGGYVAFEIMRIAPERILGVALLATSASPDKPDRQKERIQAISALEHGNFRGVTKKFLPRLLHKTNLELPVADKVMKMAMRVGGCAFLRQQQAILNRRDYRELLGGIDAPTLVGVGDSDQLTPLDEAQLIHAGIRGSKFHLFDNCGHLPPLESPDETTRILQDWISQLEQPV